LKPLHALDPLQRENSFITSWVVDFILRPLAPDMVIV
jgi:hypothetical protein